MKKTYKKHFVVFMDILKYKSLVYEAEKDKDTALEMIEKIETTINKCIKKTIAEMKEHLFFDLEYVLFSDSLCLFAPVDESEEGERGAKFNGHSQKYVDNNFCILWALCRLIANIQLESLQYGILYRGAIAVGNHYHSKNVTFSKALVDAYLAETNEAVYPRIIILNSPEQDILEWAPLLHSYYDLRVAEDDDYLFVDYLGAVAELHGLLGADCDYIKWHKSVIEANLEENLGNKKLLLKYAWMMNYHHSRLGLIFGKEICINNDLRRKVAGELGLHVIDFFI